MGQNGQDREGPHGKSRDWLVRELDQDKDAGGQAQAPNQMARYLADFLGSLLSGRGFTAARGERVAGDGVGHAGTLELTLGLTRSWGAEYGPHTR